MERSPPYVISTTTRRRGGHAEEFLTHSIQSEPLSVLKKELGWRACYCPVRLVPRYPPPKTGRLEITVTIRRSRTRRCHATIVDAPRLISSSSPIRNLQEEEQRRFEILEAHWDLPSRTRLGSRLRIMFFLSAASWVTVRSACHERVGRGKIGSSPGKLTAAQELRCPCRVSDNFDDRWWHPAWSDESSARDAPINALRAALQLGRAVRRCTRCGPSCRAVCVIRVCRHVAERDDVRVPQRNNSPSLSRSMRLDSPNRKEFVVVQVHHFADSRERPSAGLRSWRQMQRVISSSPTSSD